MSAVLWTASAALAAHMPWKTSSKRTITGSGFAGRGWWKGFWLDAAPWPGQYVESILAWFVQAMKERIGCDQKPLLLYLVIIPCKLQVAKADCQIQLVTFPRTPRCMLTCELPSTCNTQYAIPCTRSPPGGTGAPSPPRPRRCVILFSAFLIYTSWQRAPDGALISSC